MISQLIIPAAGRGLRLGAPGPKALAELSAKPLIIHTLERVLPIIDGVPAIVVVPIEYMKTFHDTISTALPDAPFQLVEGGAERQQSVENGLANVAPGVEVVVVHDAARPFVPEQAIRTAIKAAAEYGASTVAIPCVDTILQADESGFLESTPDRKSLWACQTPQCFRVEVLRAAHARARQENFVATDDATLVRRSGGRVKIVEGSPYNMKLTTPADFAVARALIAEGLV